MPLYWLISEFSGSGCSFVVVSSIGVGGRIATSIALWATQETGASQFSHCQRRFANGQTNLPSPASPAPIAPVVRAAVARPAPIAPRVLLSPGMKL